MVSTVLGRGCALAVECAVPCTLLGSLGSDDGSPANCHTDAV